MNQTLKGVTLNGQAIDTGVQSDEEKRNERIDLLKTIHEKSYLFKKPNARYTVSKKEMKKMNGPVKFLDRQEIFRVIGADMIKELIRLKAARNVFICGALLSGDKMTSKQVVEFLNQNGHLVALSSVSSLLSVMQRQSALNDNILIVDDTESPITYQLNPALMQLTPMQLVLLFKKSTTLNEYKSLVAKHPEIKHIVFNAEGNLIGRVVEPVKEEKPVTARVKLASPKSPEEVNVAAIKPKTEPKEKSTIEYLQDMMTLIKSMKITVDLNIRFGKL